MPLCFELGKWNDRVIMLGGEGGTPLASHKILSKSRASLPQRTGRGQCLECRVEVLKEYVSLRNAPRLVDFKR